MGREDRELVPLGSAFDVARRGYDRSQVDEHLERVDADLRILAADRDAAVAKAAELSKQVDNQRIQIHSLQVELDRSSAPPTTIEGLSERLARMLRLAQDEAADIRARAETETAEAIAAAEADAGALRDRYQRLLKELDERRVQMEAEHQKVMVKANTEAERMVSETTEQVRKLDEDAAARRQQVEEDFDIAMAARRTEAMELLAEQEAASKLDSERRVRDATAEANRRLQDATERAQRILGSAQHKVDGLLTIRAKIAGQLREARSMLAAAAVELEPLPEEEPAEPQPAGVSVGSDPTGGPTASHPGPAAAHPGSTAVHSSSATRELTSPEHPDAARPEPSARPESTARSESTTADQAVGEEPSERRSTNRAVAINRL
jgi:DivIVA domain-containing protein